jgi:phage gp29-like protein
MTLYDAYGRKVDTGRLKVEQAAATLAGVRNIYATQHVAAGITPERLSAVLRTAEFGDPYYYLEFCQDIEERDLHYLAVLSTRKEAVAGLQPIVKPASKDALDQKIAAFVTDTLLNGKLDVPIIDMLDALGKGFSATEIIWEFSDRDWIPVRLVLRDPRWFLFDWVSGEELLVRSMAQSGVPAVAVKAAPEPGATWGPDAGIQPMSEPLAPFKFITHIARAKSGLPIRGGLARAAAWAYLFKIYVLKDWMTFCEVYGQPLRVGKYGPGATEADKNTLLTAVANIGTDAAVIFPDSMLIEFVEARNVNSTGELYEKACTYIDDSLSKAILGQTLTTQMPRGGGGSRAAAQVHDAVRRDILASDARRLVATINRDLVRPLIDLSHFGPQKVYPRFELGLPDTQDMKIFGDVVSTFIDHGLRVGQRVILDKLGLPEPEEGEPILTPKAQLSGDAPPADALERPADEDIEPQAQKKSLWRDY